MCSNKINSIINIDLHIHSIYSAYKEEKGYVDDSNEENIDILLEKLNENNINLFSITDHNNFNFHLYELLKEKISGSDYPNVINILPGIEFDVLLEEGKESCHIITVFDDSSLDKISNIETVLKSNKQLTKKNEYYTKDEFEKILKEINCSVVLIAHQHKSLDNPEGGKRSLSNSVDDVYEFISTGYINALEYQKPSVQGMIINSLNKADKNIATIIGSDCHKWEHYPCKDERTQNKNYVTKIKALADFDGLVFAFTSTKTRFNRIDNKNNNYIKSIKCNNKEYPLCNGINAIIGDNGSGKTLLLELMENGQLKTYYSKIVKNNQMSIEKTGTPRIEYIRQNEIIENVKKGELFKKEKNNYFNEIMNKELFAKNIREYSNNIIKYIQETISYKTKKDSLEALQFTLVKHEQQLFNPTVNKDLNEIKNIYSARYNELNKIYALLEKEYSDNKSFYDDNFKTLGEEVTNIGKINLELKKLNEEIIKCNEIINLIKSALETFDTNIENKRTDKEKENNDYQSNLTNFCNEISNVINEDIKKREIPKFPKTLPGESKNMKNGFYFVKKAKYNDVDISTMYYNELFNGNYDQSNIFNIDSEEDLVKSLNGITNIDNLSNWYKSVEKFIEKYSAEETFIEKKADKKVIGKTPGEISIVYYDFKFNNFDSNKDVLLIDQPEDDISNNKISEDLINYIEKVRDKKQIIIVTHNPLLVVNLDVDNVICINKNNSDELSIKSGCLEYKNSDYSIIDEIASLLDGGREAIERRFKLYENSKCKNKI